MSNFSDSSFSFQNKRHEEFKFPILPRKRARLNTIKKAVLHIKTLGIPLISVSTGQSCDSISLKPHIPYTFGRKPKLCDFILTDRRVSKQHCQLLYDSLKNTIYLSDGLFIDCNDYIGSFSSASTRVSLNGAFINWGRVSGVVELRVGDVVSFICGSEAFCSLPDSIGFVVERIIFAEEVDDRSMIGFDSSTKRIEQTESLELYRVVDSTNVLLSWCRDILCSDDPLSYIRKWVVLDQYKKTVHASEYNCYKDFGLLPNNSSKISLNDGLKIECRNRKRVYSREVQAVGKCDDQSVREIKVVLEKNRDVGCSKAFALNDNAENQNNDPSGIAIEHDVSVAGIFTDYSSGKRDGSQHKEVLEDENSGFCIMPPGKKFYLNRLHLRDQVVEETDNVVSLPQLFHPIESLKRVFIATFTSDIPWFLSYCKIPVHLPVTISCHNAERCWSSDPDKRSSVPFSDFPNLTVVYPLFPEVIAFNKDRRNSGIGCHHPKLFVLQRENSLRVVISSANLVARQWHNVTNTVWWQDFPRLKIPDSLPIFTRLSVEEININLNNDFAAQLAGFMAFLVADVPVQAHWILELMKYDFGGADGYLVFSVPGIHSRRSPLVSESKNHMVGNTDRLKSCGVKLLASAEASIVGLSHIYRMPCDSSGAQLKKLALFLGKCQENINGMSEVVLRRDTNNPADRNAVSVLIPNLEAYSVEDYVQLGFLPRHIAKWVAPLSDIGVFAFSAFIYPKEALATALEGKSNKVKLILYIYEGPSFAEISELKQPECVSAVCSLVASSQRCTGLWRLKEVLGRYKWPEHLESEFFFGSSSVGSVNAQFLAAFSAAAGKQSVSFADSEESDPDWGCWSASQELKNPSLRIIFPSIETVKNNKSGIMSSRRLLCFSQKTWERLKNVNIVHDAVPYPSNRVGVPMHVKVGRRKFKSKDGSSSGWLYCGSHNLSAAAWGRPLSSGESCSRNISVLGSRLHISNYELGIIFIVPPPDSSVPKNGNLEDIVLPFVVPPPRYRPGDRPATAQAMREAMTQLKQRELEMQEEEVPEEEEDEVLESAQFVTVEKEDELAYADKLWSLVDSQ